MSCFFLVYFSRVSAGWPCAVPGVGVQDPLTCGRVPEQDPGGCSSLQGGAAIPCVREPTELLLSRRIRALGATKLIFLSKAGPAPAPAAGEGALGWGCCRDGARPLGASTPRNVCFIALALPDNTTTPLTRDN